MNYFTLGKFYLVVFLVLETQATQWFNQKYFHRPLYMTTDDLRHFAYPTTKSNFESILDPLLVPRVSGTENNRVVRKYIINHMQNLGWAIETDAFEDDTPHGRKDFENIVATLNPHTPRRLVLACHFDSKYFRENNFVGAIDSAVPCAMMMHLASALKNYLDAHKETPNQNATLQFVFFDGEEAFQHWSGSDNTYGSRHLAELWEKTPYPPENTEKTNTLHRIDMLVLLDLIGTKNPTFQNFFQSTAHWHNDLVQIETALRNSRMWSGNARGRTHFNPDPAYGGVEDDHLPFLHRSVDILHVIATPFPKVWHTPKDNKEALDFPTIDNLNRIFRVFIARYLHLKDSTNPSVESHGGNTTSSAPLQTSGFMSMDKTCSLLISLTFCYLYFSSGLSV